MISKSAGHRRSVCIPQAHQFGIWYLEKGPCSYLNKDEALLEGLPVVRIKCLADALLKLDSKLIKNNLSILVFAAFGIQPFHDGIERCWRASNGICSKRLVPYLPELVAALERHGELHLDRVIKEKLLSLSPATADRLLAPERQRNRLHGLSTTRPGTRHRVGRCPSWLHGN